MGEGGARVPGGSSEYAGPDDLIRPAPEGGGGLLIIMAGDTVSDRKEKPGSAFPLFFCHLPTDIHQKNTSTDPLNRSPVRRCSLIPGDLSEAGCRPGEPQKRCQMRIFSGDKSGDLRQTGDEMADFRKRDCARYVNMVAQTGKVGKQRLK